MESSFPVSSFHELVCFRRCFKKKLLQNSQSLRNFCFWGCKEAALSLIQHIFFCFLWKNALVMRMRMIEKYAVPYCLILSDALSREQKTSYDRSCNIFASKWMHVGLNLCVLSEIYKSEMRDAQVYGSLLLTLLAVSLRKQLVLVLCLHWVIETWFLTNQRTYFLKTKTGASSHAMCHRRSSNLSCSRWDFNLLAIKQVNQLLHRKIVDFVIMSYLPVELQFK